MKWQNIVELVPQPGAAFSLQDWIAPFPAIEHMKTTPQSARWHAEGDVFIHTTMVCEELLASPVFAAMSRDDQVTVFIAAVLHDISKYSTTVFDEATGEPRQPGHSRKGSIDARIALWDAGAPFAVREEICRMISVHQAPFHVLGDNPMGIPPDFRIRKLSWTCNLRLLALLAEVDIRGRICEDKQKLLDDIELFREFAREEGCYETPRAFASDHTRVRYFRGAEAHPDYALFQEPGSKVTMMCGLPAVGKNTWIEEHRKDLDVVSYDGMREELGLRHGKNEGMVTHAATGRVKELLRVRKPFVLNATHLSEQMRSKALGLLYDYNAEVELVYLEKPRAELLRRNTKRDTSLSNKALEAMLFKWDLPLPFEADRVVYEV